MQPSNNILLGALLSLAIVLPGCEVGPNYSRPKVEQPAEFKSQAATQPVPRISAQWWRLYHDAELDQLIATANQSNQSLRQAVARLDQARALARVAASYLLPTVTGNPSFARARTSTNSPSTITGQPTGKSVAYSDWQIPFDLTYEIDIWGRVRRSVEASTAQRSSG
jgi:multidrug efflux system outer membrane protein